MSTIFGLAGLTASDYQFGRNVDKALIYDAVQQYVAMANQTAMEARALFIESTTEKFSERYQLGLTGRMQRMSDQNKAKAVRRSGSWDVGYPLEQFGDDLVTTRVDFAYMTPAEFQAHVDGVITRANNAQRFEILRRIFKNTTDTFVDPRNGSITIQPLANGDTVVYPPVEGSETEATDDHYLESGYATAAISDTNNPITTIVNELVEHTGDMTGDIPCAIMINPAEQPYIEALTSFVPYVPTPIQPGTNTDLVSLPPYPVPGKIIGYFPGGAWISVWRWMPATYMVGVNFDAPAPLKMRVDPAETGLADRGVLALTGTLNDYPLTYNEWSLRFGVGTGNRTGAVVMEMGTGGTYTIPTIYQ